MLQRLQTISKKHPSLVTMSAYGALGLTTSMLISSLSSNAYSTLLTLPFFPLTSFLLLLLSIQRFNHNISQKIANSYIFCTTFLISLPLWNIIQAIIKVLKPAMPKIWIHRAALISLLLSAYHYLTEQQLLQDPIPVETVALAVLVSGALKFALEKTIPLVLETIFLKYSIYALYLASIACNIGCCAGLIILELNTLYQYVTDIEQSPLKSGKVTGMRAAMALNLSVSALKVTIYLLYIILQFECMLFKLTGSLIFKNPPLKIVHGNTSTMNAAASIASFTLIGCLIPNKEQHLKKDPAQDNNPEEPVHATGMQF